MPVSAFHDQPFRGFPQVLGLLLLMSFAGSGCDVDAPVPDEVEAADDDGEVVQAFVGATLLDGTGDAAVDDAVLLVREGRVLDAGSADAVEVPEEARVEDLSGRHVLPGFVNAHGHVGTADGLETGGEVHTRENVLRQLELYAHYGVTSVVSLGDPGEETLRARDEAGDEGPGRARVWTSGPVLNPGDPEEAEEAVAQHADRGVDWIKFRVDDFLGQAEKMQPEVYGAILDAARDHGIPVAAHMVELGDARDLLERGVDVLAHSVRDDEVDEAFLDAMTEADACLTPTFTREVSTFVYASRPEFFDDPFFLETADPEVLDELTSAEYQSSVAESESAAYFREALPTAMENMVATHEAGGHVALGTDSGPPARFQGYFEHMEMEMMQEAGMPPEDVVHAATGRAADCMGLDDVGTLEEGRWADFVVLDADPTEDITATRSLAGVWIAGERVR